VGIKQSHEVVTECRLVSPNSSPHNHLTNHAPLTGISPPAGQFATGTGPAEFFLIELGCQIQPETPAADMPNLFVCIAGGRRHLVE
jgi:hypothetical protein